MPCNDGLWSESDSVDNVMTTDPEEIRARIDAVLAELPDPADAENMPAEADLEELARRLSEAHDMLVQALESAEKG
jgi:RecJ-like exonuclease